MLKKEILIVIVAAVACLLSAAELPETVKFSNNGSFRIGDAEFYIQNYSSAWKPSLNGNWQNRKEKLNRSGLTLSAVMPVGGQKADVTEGITPTGDAEFRLNFQAKFREPVVINALHGVFLVPAAEMMVFVDGKHAIFHNKVMVIDDRVVLTGSFNYKDDAENDNAENMLRLESAELARRYAADWEKHRAHAKPVPSKPINCN